MGNSTWIGLEITSSELDEIKDRRLREPLHMTLAFIRGSHPEPFPPGQANTLLALIAGAALALRPPYLRQQGARQMAGQKLAVLVHVDPYLRAFRANLIEQLKRLGILTDSTWEWLPHVTLSATAGEYQDTIRQLLVATWGHTISAHHIFVVIDGRKFPYHLSGI